jgi:ribosomal-protein-alanine N-acetyltransferase
MRGTRLLSGEDAPRLAELLVANREFLAPWDPVRPEAYFTPDGQRASVEVALQQHRQGVALPHVILDDDGTVVGRITLSGIERGPFQSCHMGYWVSRHANGRGLATAAVAALVERAFGGLGLHRVEAGTLPHNARSQRVLERNGFVRFGFAPHYLNIAGRWQDHVLYQRIAPRWQTSEVRAA